MADDETRKRRWKGKADKPFEPATLMPGGETAATDVRSAAALEYIAAQLGILNAKLDQLSGELKTAGLLNRSPAHATPSVGFALPPQTTRADAVRLVAETARCYDDPKMRTTPRPEAA